MTSNKIEEMFDKVSDDLDKDRNEIVFYSGSPDPDFLIISEAPTEKKNSKDTLFNDIKEKFEDPENDEIFDFLRKYPFEEEPKIKEEKTTRNTLYTQFVEKILYFLDEEEKREKIGFTDVCKEPLEEDDQKFSDESVISELMEIIDKQIKFAQPDIIICNKKNVSKRIYKKYNPNNETTDPYDLEFKKLPTKMETEIKGKNTTVFFSSMIHSYLDNFNKKRISNCLKEEYNQ